ncbi:MAG: hypothetical protein GYA50_04530 [Eubacteriaceae bacterium]|nr:hypothetical protein [Eubacteriaceae bacterium]
MDKMGDNNWQYKSGWRPIYIENDSSLTSVSKNNETPQKKPVSNINQTHNIKSDNVINSPDNIDILKLLSDINTKIDTLNRNLTKQNENMNNLFNYFKTLETTADKKSVFDFLKKLTE